MPFVDPVYTGIPLGATSEYLQGTLEHHCKNLGETVPHWNATEETLSLVANAETPLENLAESAPHWNATRETLIVAAYTGIPLEGLRL